MFRAACVLHNIAINDGINLEKNIPEQINEYEIHRNDEDDRNAENIRNFIVETLAI